MAVSRQGLALAVALAAPAALSLVVRGAHPFVALGCWTFTVGVAFYGAGMLLDRVFAGGASSRLLRIGWGMALYEWAVGCLSAIRHGGRAPVFVGIMVGFAFGLYDLATAPPSFVPIMTRVRRSLAARRMVTAAVAFAFAFAALRAALSLRTRAGAFLYDDAEAYTVFVRQLVETGDFDQPFCIRRLQSFGGMTGLISTLYSSGGDEWSHGYAFDWGMAYVLTLAFVASARAPSRAGSYVRAAAVILVAFVSQVRANMTPQYTPVFLGLVLVRTLGALDRRTNLGRRILVGLVAAGICALRQSLVPWVVLIVLSHHFLAWKDSQRDRLERTRTFVVDGALTVFFLVPWAVQTQRAFGTPLFPLIRGDFTSDGASFIGASVPFVRHLANLVATVNFSMPFTLAALVLLALAWVGRRWERESTVLVVSGAVAYAAQLYTLPTTDLGSHGRYAFGWAMAAGVGIMMAAISARRDSRWVQGAAIAAVIVEVAVARDVIVRSTYDDLRWESHTPLASRPGGDEGPRNARYSSAQAVVPSGERIFTMAEESYRLDFRRNPIVILDFPGALGRPTPFPARAGALAILDYIRGQGFRFVLFEHAAKGEGMLSRAAWAQHIDQTDDDAARALAPWWLATFDAFDAIARERGTLYDDGIVAVVDLEK